MSVFDNEEKALKANAQFKTYGYQVSKFNLKRPSRDYCVSFKVLSPVTIQVGRSLTSSRIGVLEKNDIIRVNQVKGRRARIISSEWPARWMGVFAHRGRCTAVGAVSRHTYSDLLIKLYIEVEIIFTTRIFTELR